MVRKIIYISIFTFWLQTSLAIAGTTGSEELKDTSSQSATEECFEGFSRAMFNLNYDLDRNLEVISVLGLELPTHHLCLKGLSLKLTNYLN